MNDLYTIINQGRYHPAQHPCCRKRTNNQQDNNRTAHSRNVIHNRMLYIFPLNAITGYSDERTQRSGYQQTDLTSSTQCIAAKKTDSEKQQNN